MSRGPCGLAQLLGGRSGGLGGVAAALLVGADDRTAACDEAARGVRLERRTEVARAAALSADAGEQEDRPRHQLAEVVQEVWPRGAGHRPDRGEPALADLVAAHLVDDPR